MNTRLHNVSILTALFLSIALAAPCEGAETIDVISYTMDVAIHEDGIKETVIIKAKPLKKVKNVELRLAEAMKIQTCLLGDEEVAFSRDGWDCRLDLSKHKLSKDEFSITFELRGRPYVRFSESRGGFTRTNVCSEHAYIRSQYAWYPRKDNDPATFDVSLAARKDWQAHTAGRLQEQSERDDLAVRRFVQENPIRRIGLAAGPYEVVEERTSDGLIIDALVFAGHEEAGRLLIKMAVKAMEFYSSIFGAVHVDRFRLVEMPAAFGKGSGYGETGYVLLGTGAFDDAGESPWVESLVAHEVCHTWWGQQVGFKHFASEALATYGTQRYMEMAHGEEEARKERKRSIRKIVTVANDVGEADLADIRNWGANMDPQVYTVHAYEKGAMILHMLETAMGRDEFDALLQQFFKKHQGKVIDYKTLKKELGGKKWKGIFDQWGKPGIPQLTIEHEAARSGSDYRVKGKLLQEGLKKPFKMDVTLRARSGEKVFDHKVNVKKASTAISFKCPFEPKEILIDPNGDIIYCAPVPFDFEAIKKSIFAVANSPNLRDEAKLTKALSDIDRVLETSPESDSVFHTAKGRCLFRLGKFKEAMEEFETALKGGAGGPFHRQWIYLRMGCIADLKKKRKEAKKYYKKAIATNGSDFALGKAERFLEKPYRGHKVDG